MLHEFILACSLSLNVKFTYLNSWKYSKYVTFAIRCYYINRHRLAMRFDIYMSVRLFGVQGLYTPGYILLPV